VAFLIATPVASCRPPSARMMASDRRADVYAWDGAVYACDRRTGKRIRLGNARRCIAAALVDRAAVAGDVIAYGTERCGVDTGSASVSVLRLPGGKKLRSLAAATGAVGPESYQSVDSLVVKRDGAVAWIATARSIIGRGTRIEVHANAQLLDSGPGIVGSSLRIHGSTLTWRHGTAMRSARLT
jgi:hypothetical protein